MDVRKSYKLKGDRMVEDRWPRHDGLFGLVKEFHTAAGQPVNLVPNLPSQERRLLRSDLINEELGEYLIAEDKNDLEGIADALADLIYVAAGAALEYGIDIDAVLEEVHRSNMSKLEGGGEYDENGKVSKPLSYNPPDIPAVISPAKNGR